MERNMGDQVNKAFEVYRQASIEKDLAKKELEKMTEYYVRYTQELQQKIEEQRQLITKLEAQLSSATGPPPGEMKCEARKRGLGPRKREEAAAAAPCVHRSDRTTDFRKTRYLKENMETVAVAPKLPIKNNLDKQGMLEAFEAIQGKFQQIQFLTRRQKDHLKRFHGGSDPSNDQQFSMPIQCTDDTAELAERAGPSARRAAVTSVTPGASATSVTSAGVSGTSADVPRPSDALASRGAGPEDRDLVDSLTRLSVKFPPASDCEYDFLNSAPERRPAPGKPGPPPPQSGPPLPLAAVTEELPAADRRAAPPFGFPPRSPSSRAAGPASSLSEESGPRQPLWDPVEREGEREGERGSPGGGGGGGGGSPDKCAFCYAVVPQERMNSHLYFCFSHQREASSK